MHVSSGFYTVKARPGGFTLLELTLALLITAIVMSMVYGSIRTISRSLNTLSLRNELYRTNYALLEEMARELSSAFISKQNTIIQNNVRTYFYVKDVEENRMPQDRLYFTTFGHALSPNPVGEGDQSEVCYHARYIQEIDELILMKKEDITPDNITCQDEEFDLELPFDQRPFVVASGIHTEKGQGYRFTGFDVKIYPTTQKEEEPLEEWDSENNTTQKNMLPSLVKITLTYEGPAKDIINFQKTVWLQLGGQ